MFRLKGSILSMSFLDCNGALIPYSYEPWKDDNRGNDGSRRDRKATLDFTFDHSMKMKCLFLRLCVWWVA